MVQLVRLCSLSPAGKKSDLVWFDMKSKPSPIWPQLSDLHISSLSCSPSSCTSTNNSAWRTHFHADSYIDFKAYPVLSSRKPCTPVFFPIRVTLCDSHPPACSFRAEIIFIHVTRCLVHGTFPQCWLNEHRAWDTGHLESLDRVRRMPSLVYKGLLRLHYSCSNPLHCVDTLLLILLNI